MFKIIIIVIIALAIIVTTLLRIINKHLINDWRNKLVPNNPITVKCHYFVKGKPRYIYIPAIVEELIDDQHYKVIYEEDHANEAIEDHIDDGLQMPEVVHHNYICKAMTEDQLESLNTRWCFD